MVLVFIICILIFLVLLITFSTIRIQVENFEASNIENMKNQNFKVWKNIYEKTYDTKLDYTTINRSKVQKLLDM